MTPDQPSDQNDASVTGPAQGVGAPLTIDRLPGTQRPYLLRNGAGEHHLVGGQVATVIAGAAESGGVFEAVTLTGGVGATMPLHRHADADEALLILDGQLELWLDGQAHLLSRGDHASIPAGIVHGHRMLSHRTRVLAYSMGGRVAAMYRAMGTPFHRPVQPERAEASIAEDRLAAAEAVADVRFERVDPDFGAPVRVTATTLPGSATPYVLMAGEGERLVAADQLYTFLGTQATTDGKFLSVITEGPAGQMIPEHFHTEHSENFFCLDGAVTMLVAGEEITLGSGDYVQVPPHAVHAFRFDAPYTRMFGWLAPAIFEPFFRLLGDAYEPHTFPVEPPAFRFDRVMAHLPELDLHLVRRG